MDGMGLSGQLFADDLGPQPAHEDQGGLLVGDDLLQDPREEAVDSFHAEVLQGSLAFSSS